MPLTVWGRTSTRTGQARSLCQAAAALPMSTQVRSRLATHNSPSMTTTATIISTGLPEPGTPMPPLLPAETMRTFREGEIKKRGHPAPLINQLIRRLHRCSIV